MILENQGHPTIWAVRVGYLCTNAGAEEMMQSPHPQGAALAPRQPSQRQLLHLSLLLLLALTQGSLQDAPLCGIIMCFAW